jgi:Regulator of chromosome condensation (RCC1) repeat
MNASTPKTERPPRTQRRKAVLGGPLSYLSFFAPLIIALFAGPAQAATVIATYNAMGDIPVTADSYAATGNTVNFTLNFAPAVGTELMVVKNTGLGFIDGSFSNLAQGQVVALSFSGTVFAFVANYYGGSGNDLVLVWANTRPFAWGQNANGQLGDGSAMQRNVPVAVTAMGVLSGKTVVAVAAGSSHSLALCSDGTLSAWGYNSNGQLGDGTTTQRSVPTAVTTAGTPLAGKTVVAIAAGLYHCLALCSDGTVVSWGYNADGELGDGSSTFRLMAVAVTTANTPLAI